MHESTTKNGAVLYRLRAAVVDGRPVIGLVMKDGRDPARPIFTCISGVEDFEALAADLLRAVADARLMALMESRRRSPQAGREARP